MALYNQGDIIRDFLLKMNQSSSVAFYSDRTLTEWASNAHAWAASRYKWPMTEGRNSTTAASAGTSDEGWTTLAYPEGFRQDSVRVMIVDGKRFHKKIFNKFQSYLQDNPGATDRFFTDFARTLYINPRAEGFSGTVTLFGQINVAPLATDTVASSAGSIGPDPTALTVFSGVEEDGNEAIVEKMMEYAYLRQKDSKEADYHGDRAGKMLDGIWNRVKDEQAMYQGVPDDGMFERFNVLGGRYPGDFNTDQFPIR